MYLKSIEIQGFKSFANKINFQFHNGITGIVGPNGSGKSNVADAVRWVLGEQRSKQLRGGSMQDVIFAGTELRKPLSYAYVAITLDNADHHLPIDYNEVTVARRLYRSGESEYLINGSVCRLKDVNELFYDTGIGKEGYSIIGQGQIDKILSGKPEERRELFDEAAGIVKFKKRKNTAMKKLEEEGYVKQTAGKYLGLSKCPSHGDMLTRIRLQRADDGNCLMSLSVMKATAQNKAYVHTKRIQMAEKEARYLAEHGQLPDADAELDTAERNNMPFDD